MAMILSQMLKQLAVTFLKNKLKNSSKLNLTKLSHQTMIVIKQY